MPLLQEVFSIWTCVFGETFPEKNYDWRTILLVALPAPHMGRPWHILEPAPGVGLLVPASPTVEARLGPDKERQGVCGSLVSPPQRADLPAGQLPTAWPLPPAHSSTD